MLQRRNRTKDCEDPWAPLVGDRRWRRACSRWPLCPRLPCTDGCTWQVAAGIGPGDMVGPSAIGTPPVAALCNVPGRWYRPCSRLYLFNGGTEAGTCSYTGVPGYIGLGAEHGGAFSAVSSASSVVLPVACTVSCVDSAVLGVAVLRAPPMTELGSSGKKRKSGDGPGSDNFGGA